jgi:hypothetical protein
MALIPSSPQKFIIYPIRIHNLKLIRACFFQLVLSSHRFPIKSKFHVGVDLVKPENPNISSPDLFFLRCLLLTAWSLFKTGLQTLRTPDFPFSPLSRPHIFQVVYQARKSIYHKLPEGESRLISDIDFLNSSFHFSLSLKFFLLLPLGPNQIFE